MAQDTVILAANQQRTEPIAGRFFTVISCTAKFKVELDGRQRREVRAGSKIGGAAFKRISFIETEGLANTIVFDAGDEEYQGEVQVSGVSNETFDYPYFNSTGQTNIPQNSFTLLPSVVTISGVQYTRKSFHISSITSDSDIIIYDTNEKVMDGFRKTTERTFYFTGDVKLKAEMAVGANICLYYTLYRTNPEQ